MNENKEPGGKIMSSCAIHCSNFRVKKINFFIFEFPCIIILYYTKNKQDATLALLFISNCKITLHVSDASRIHHQKH